MLNSILRLARLYLDIAIWRRGPQDVPAVGILLPITMAAYVLLSLAIGESIPSLRPGLLQAMLVDVAFLALWYWLLLRIAGRSERYLQTAIAVFGLQLVVAAPGLAIIWLGLWLPADQLTHVPLYVFLPVVILQFTVPVWTLLATGHIVRSALERSRVLCLILALAQLLTEGVLLDGFYPRH
jgi:hypothetical protein